MNRAAYLAKIRGNPSVSDRVLAAIIAGAETHQEICERTGLRWLRVGLVLTSLKDDDAIRKVGRTTGSRWFANLSSRHITASGEIMACAET